MESLEVNKYINLRNNVFFVVFVFFFVWSLLHVSAVYPKTGTVIGVGCFRYVYSSVRFQMHFPAHSETAVNSLKKKWKPKLKAEGLFHVGCMVGHRYWVWNVISEASCFKGLEGTSPLAHHMDTRETLSVPEFHKCPVESSSLVCERCSQSI